MKIFQIERFLNEKEDKNTLRYYNSPSYMDSFLSYKTNKMNDFFEDRIYVEKWNFASSNKSIIENLEYIIERKDESRDKELIDVVRSLSIKMRENINNDVVYFNKRKFIDKLDINNLGVAKQLSNECMVINRDADKKRNVERSIMKLLEDLSANIYLFEKYNLGEQ